MASVYKRGDIYWANFSTADGSQNAVSTKIRISVYGPRKARQLALEQAIKWERNEVDKRVSGIDFASLVDSISTLDPSDKTKLALVLVDHLPDSYQTNGDTLTSTITYSDCRDKWLSKVSSRKSADWIKREIVCHKFFIEFVGGDTLISSVTTENVDDFIVSREGLGKAANTINNYLKPVSQLFNYAVANDLVTKNPVKYAQKPGTATVVEWDYIPDDAFDIVINDANDSDKIFWTWLRYTALNPKDVSALTPTSIEADNKGNGRHINGKRAKNGRLARIPVHPNIEKAISTYGDDCFGIYPNKSARDKSNKRFKAALASQGIYSVIAAIRHTCATNLLESGLSLDDVALIMGHSDTTMLKKIYVKHVDQVKAYEAVKRLK